MKNNDKILVADSLASAVGPNLQGFLDLLAATALVLGAKEEMADVPLCGHTVAHALQNVLAATADIFKEGYGISLGITMCEIPAESSETVPKERLN